jgi:hypothetical protein
MDRDPQRISEIMPEAEEKLRSGQIWTDEPYVDRVQRDKLQERTELATELAHLQQLADEGRATPGELRQLDEKKIELLAFDAHPGIEQAP